MCIVFHTHPFPPWFRTHVNHGIITKFSHNSVKYSFTVAHTFFSSNYLNLNATEIHTGGILGLKLISHNSPLMCNTWMGTVDFEKIMMDVLNELLCNAELQ